MGREEGGKWKMERKERIEKRRRKGKWKEKKGIKGEEIIGKREKNDKEIVR